jgi:hypothetical protein
VQDLGSSSATGLSEPSVSQRFSELAASLGPRRAAEAAGLSAARALASAARPKADTAAAASGMLGATPQPTPGGANGAAPGGDGGAGPQAGREDRDGTVRMSAEYVRTHVDEALAALAHVSAHRKRPDSSRGRGFEHIPARVARLLTVPDPEAPAPMADWERLEQASWRRRRRRHGRKQLRRLRLGSRASVSGG